MAKLFKVNISHYHDDIKCCIVLVVTHEGKTRIVSRPQSQHTNILTHTQQMTLQTE